MAAVGSGSENSWFIDQGPAPDIDVVVTVGLDEEGRFRELTVDSEEFAAFIHEAFGVTGRRTGGGFDFHVVIASFDVDAFPIAHLEPPAEPMRTVDELQYLSGIDRPMVGTCVGTWGELSLPAFEGPRSCERGVMALGPLPTVTDAFPGYTMLWAEAREGCEAIADEVLGADYIDEWGIIVNYSLASPTVWELGSHPVTCGASPGW